MNHTAFDIHAEQLHDGHHHHLSIVSSPDFLDVNEDALHFTDKVYVKGEAYLAGETLILRLAIAACAVIPCSICNEPVNYEIQISELYHTEELENIKNGIFNCAEIVREAILLDTPQFTECVGGCPMRKELGQYIKAPKARDEEDRYYPFADL